MVLMNNTNLMYYLCMYVHCSVYSLHSLAIMKSIPYCDCCNAKQYGSFGLKCIRMNGLTILWNIKLYPH